MLSGNEKIRLLFFRQLLHFLIRTECVKYLFVDCIKPNIKRLLHPIKVKVTGSD